MTRSIIYTVDAVGTLTAMRPSAPRSEDYMQHLVGQYPELIADQDGALLLIRREQAIGDSEESNGRWSLDHLFVTRSGIPVLVELKRAVDTRLRREVVGQMLDYAANGTAYWHAGRVAEIFAASAIEAGNDPDAVLAEFLAGTNDPATFWELVDTNFAAGRIKMVFVADTIPRELARIVEFLNEQMKADVRAVELSWFESESGVTALTPRIIGETERAQTAKSARGPLPSIGRDEWIAQHFSPLGADTVDAAHNYVRIVEETGGQAELPSTQGSIVAVFYLPDCTIYPFALSRYSKGAVQLCLGYLAARPGFVEERARRDLYDRLVSIVGPLSTKSMNGSPSFPVTKLNDPAVQEGVRNIIHYVTDIVRKAAS